METPPLLAVRYGGPDWFKSSLQVGGLLGVLVLNVLVRLRWRIGLEVAIPVVAFLLGALAGYLAGLWLEVTGEEIGMRRRGPLAALVRRLEGRLAAVKWMSGKRGTPLGEWAVRWREVEELRESGVGRGRSLRVWTLRTSADRQCVINPAAFGGVELGAPLTKGLGERRLEAQSKEWAIQRVREEIINRAELTERLVKTGRKRDREEEVIYRRPAPAGGIAEGLSRTRPAPVSGTSTRRPV